MRDHRPDPAELDPTLKPRPFFTEARFADHQALVRRPRRRFAPPNADEHARAKRKASKVARRRNRSAR